MLSKIKFYFEQSWLLMVGAIVFGTLLAATDAAWRPRIEQNTAARFNALAGGLLAQATRFEPPTEPISVEIGGKATPVNVQKGLDDDGNVVGWAFVCEGSGFADKIRLVVGVDAAFETLAGFRVLASNETPGFGDKINPTPDEPGGAFQRQFVGAPTQTLMLTKSGDMTVIDDHIVAITGATVTSQAVVDTLNVWMEPIREKLQAEGLLE